MGFFARRTYKGICRAMLRSYKQARQQNQGMPERELAALALSQRPTYKRKVSDSFVFSTKHGDFEIKKEDTIEDVVRNMIMRETIPFGASRDSKFVTSTIQEIVEVVDSELKKFNSQQKN